MPGLTLLEGVVTEEEEVALIALADREEGARWAEGMRRRVQHYG